MSRAKGRGAVLKKVSVLIPVVMLPLGAWLGYRTFEDRSAAEIWSAVTGLPAFRLILAFACAAGSYLCLTGFDTLAIRTLGKRIAYPKIALTSFISLGIGHTVGVAVLSSGALRYRLYAGFGLTAGDVAKVILLCAVTVGLGLIGLGGLSLVVRPHLDIGGFEMSPFLARSVGALCLALLGLYVFTAWRRKTPLHVRGHEIRLPNARIAMAQVALGIVNFAFVAGTLYQLLAGAASYGQTVSAYVIANLSALVSHVPGGIGVLEYVISKLVNHGDVLGALIAFRIIYFLVPLTLAITLLIATEAYRWRRKKQS
ncbi:MAG: hypothetical protein AB7H70_00200 [Rhodospirillaceae bacterium]